MTLHDLVTAILKAVDEGLGADNEVLIVGYEDERYHRAVLPVREGDKFVLYEDRPIAALPPNPGRAHGQGPRENEDIPAKRAQRQVRAAPLPLPGMNLNNPPLGRE